MTRCQRCGRSTPTPVRLVIETRPRTYPPRPKANFVRPGAIRKPRPHTTADVRRLVHGKHKWIVRDDPGGVGWEIAREGMFCPACAATRAEAFG